MCKKTHVRKKKMGRKTHEITRNGKNKKLSHYFMLINYIRPNYLVNFTSSLWVKTPIAIKTNRTMSSVTNKKSLITCTPNWTYWKIGLKLESSNIIPPFHLLPLSSPFSPLFKTTSSLPLRFFSLKKQKKLFFTILSGPHVHKKARQQFHLDYHRSLLYFTLSSLSDYKRFLLFKSNLFFFHYDLSFHFSFFYFRRDSISGFLTI